MFRSLAPRLTLIATGIACAGTLAAQNDNCGEAVTLIMGTSCVPYQGSVYNAYQSIPAITCNGYSGTADEDVWFLFVATATDATIQMTCFLGFDGVIDLRSGTCDGVNIDCADAFGEAENESLSVTGLTLGATYYIRVYEFGEGIPAGFDFNLCVWSPNAISGPANDECAQAISLPMSNACIPVPGTAAGASDSNVAASCNGQGASDDDVWYSFVATGGDVRITVDADGTYDPIVHLRFGCPGNSIACADQTGAGGTETIEFEGISIGNTYSVQIYDAGTGQPLNTTFTICVQDITAVNGLAEPGANDGPWLVSNTNDPRVLSLSGIRDLRTTWSVLDALGRQVIAGSGMIGPTKAAMLEMNAWPAGTCTLILSSEGERMFKRIILP